MFHGKLQCVRLKRTTPDRRGRVILYMHGLSIHPFIYITYLPTYPSCHSKISVILNPETHLAPWILEKRWVPNDLPRGPMWLTAVVTPLMASPPPSPTTLSGPDSSASGSRTLRLTYLSPSKLSGRLPSFSILAYLWHLPRMRTLSQTPMDYRLSIHSRKHTIGIKC